MKAVAEAVKCMGQIKIVCAVYGTKENRHNINGLVQDCSNSSVLAMELLQYRTKPSTDG